MALTNLRDGAGEGAEKGEPCCKKKKKKSDADTSAEEPVRVSQPQGRSNLCKTAVQTFQARWDAVCFLRVLQMLDLGYRAG